MKPNVHTVSSPRWRGGLRGIATVLGRLAIGEPAAILPQRSVDRLNQLERGEMLRQAERDGDADTLDRELARAQLTDSDLAQLSSKITPLGNWPDEDVDAMFGPNFD